MSSDADNLGSTSNSPADVPSEGRGELLPFNLSDALAGKPVVTRERRRVSKLKYAKWSAFGLPLTGVIEDDIHTSWDKNGRHFKSGADSPDDLFMLPPEGSGA